MGKLFFLLLIAGGLQAQSPGQPVKLPGLPRPLYWENTPVSFSTANGQLMIEAGEKTDMFRDPKDISDDCNHAAATTNTIYYKMAKAGNVITLYFSTGGKSWYLVRHLVFDAHGPLHLGFLAQSLTGKSCRATFSGIHYSTKKIADPYLGE